mgnify:CR=1 FL=1
MDLLDDGRPGYFVWPDDDTSYMKMVFRYPDERYPAGFHVLGSRYHPVGDFDDPGVKLPKESLRIYKTAHGWRVFFTDRYNVNVSSMFDELDSLGGDKLYSRYGRRKKYFAMRVDPKVPTPPKNWAVTKLIEQVGTPRPEWQSLISEHDRLTRALEPGTILV